MLALDRRALRPAHALPSRPEAERAEHRLAFVGAGLMLGNWVGTAACSLLILTGLIYRLQREEHAMIDSLGDAYLDFAKDRARLVPFVW